MQCLLSQRFSLTAILAIFLSCNRVIHADVFNWVTGAVIAGTKGITPGPGVDFDGFNLSYADFSGFDLRDADFEIADLSHALFSESYLEDASFDHAILTGTDFSDAVVRGASFRRSRAPLQSEQLYSTASYQMKDLRGIEINIDMRGWELAGQDLTDADFFGAFLGRADLTDAIINGVFFPWRAGPDSESNDAIQFSNEQFYSTASYKEKNLRRVIIANSDLAGWDFSGQDLRCSDFFGSNFAVADLTNTDLRNVRFWEGIEVAIFDSNTIYNEWTTFPPDFDPSAAGLTFKSSLGDFDLNDVLNDADIDALTEMSDEDRERGWREISQCSTAVEQFVLLDGKPTFEGDHRFWVKELKNTYYGDANLDGEFNSADLVQVFEAGEYEDDLANNSGWADGDWNADREFTSSDLVVAFQDSGFEQGPRIVAKIVPEPDISTLMTVGLFGLCF